MRKAEIKKLQKRIRTLSVRLLLCFVMISFPLWVHALGESIYRLKPSRDIVLGAGGGFLFLGSYFWLSSPSAYTSFQLDALQPKGLDRIEKRAINNWSPTAGQISEVTAFLAGFPALALLFSEQASAEWLPLTVMTTNLVLWSAALPQLAKVTIQRNRPYAYNPAAGLEDRLSSRARESFFSRTSTMAFASAVYTSILFDDFFPDSGLSPWIWSAALTMAGSAAWLKYHSGQHFPTDIITGAALGSFLGWYFPRMYKKKNPALSNVWIAPAGNGLWVGVNFKF